MFLHDGHKIQFTYIWVYDECVLVNRGEPFTVIHTRSGISRHYSKSLMSGFGRWRCGPDPGTAWSGRHNLCERSKRCGADPDLGGPHLAVDENGAFIEDCV